MEQVAGGRFTFLRPAGRKTEQQNRRVAAEVTSVTTTATTATATTATTATTTTTANLIQHKQPNNHPISNNISTLKHEIDRRIINP